MNFMALAEQRKRIRRRRTRLPGAHSRSTEAADAAEISARAIGRAPRLASAEPLRAR